MTTLEAWLADLGLEKYVPAFADQEVGLDQIPTLTDADLKELGLPLGPRKRILDAATRLGVQASTAIQPNPPAAERRQVTIVFVDLVGSTALSGRLDPEDLRTVLQAYHETCAAVISRWGGLVAKLMGDGVLAYFGWPAAQESSAERAVRAGLDINAAVAKLTTPEGEPMAARTGIATGLVVIGDLIGEGAAQEAAVAGETPNLAARLQASAEPGGLVVSDLTYSLAGAQFVAERRGPLPLKGIAEPVYAHVVTGVRDGVTRFAARASQEVSPLLGRDAELALVLDRLQRAHMGEGQLVVLTGDAGMGKSRLAHAVLQAIGRTSSSPTVWQCAPYHTSTAFHPVLPSLSDQSLTRLQADERAALEGLRTGVGALSHLSPAQARFLTLSALGRAVISSASDGETSVLLVEDAHWIDPSTLEVLDANLEAWSRCRVFVLVTARPSFQHDFGGRSCVTTLSLTRMSRVGVDALATGVAGGLSLPTDVLDEIAARSDGVPLYVEETTKALLASGALKRQGATWTLAGQLTSSGVPASLADGLMSRLDRLAGAKETAQEAAVVGRQFSYEEAHAIVSTPPDRLYAALKSLEDAQIVVPVGDAIQQTFQFRHALLRDAAYDSLLKSRRAALHAKFARHLETKSGAALELRAWHVEAAGRREDAIDLWRRAGEAAMARPAFHEAIAHFRRARDLARGPEVLKIETRLGLAAIAAQGHSHPATLAIFEEASRRPQLAADAASAFVVWYGLWCGHHVRGEAANARESSLGLHRAALADGSPANVMMGVRSLGITALMNGDVETALSRHEEAATLEDLPRDRAQAHIVGQDQSVSFRSYFGITLWRAGQAARAWAMIEESVTFARSNGHPGSLGYGLTHAILAAIGLGKDDAAHEWATELKDRATTYRLGMWRDYADRFLGLMHLKATGDERIALAARDALAGREVGLFSAYLDAVAASALMDRGALDRARTWLDWASDALKPGRESWAAPEVKAAKAQWAELAGRPSHPEES